MKEKIEILKDTKNKLPYDLLPVKGLREVVKVFDFGSKKYKPRNWENGIQWSKLYAAALRHLMLFWEGQDLDKESKLLSIAHATWNCLALTEYYFIHKELDDRNV